MLPTRLASLGLALCLLLPVPVRAELPGELPSLPPTLTPSKEALRLDLPDAMQMAVAGSPRRAASLARIREALAEAEVAASPARLRAAVNTRAEYLQYPGGPPRRVVVDGVEQIQRPESVAYVQGYGALDVRQLLYDGGRVRARIEELQAVAGQQEARSVADLRELELEVQKSYLEALGAREQTAVAKEQEDLATQHVRTARLLFEAGKVPRGDVIQAETSESGARLDLLRAEAAAREAEEALAAVIGLPLEVRLDLADPPVPPALEQGLDACIAEALAQRPSLRATRMALLAAERSVTAAERDDNAQVEAFADMAGYGFNEGLGSVGYNVGVQYSWPLLDGSRSAWMRERAQARVEAARAQVREDERLAEADVRSAWRAVDLAGATYRQAQARLAQAREGLRIAEGQYRAGRTGFPPLREAALDVRKARLEQAGAYYDYLRARARLDFACGRPPVP